MMNDQMLLYVLENEPEHDPIGGYMSSKEAINAGLLALTTVGMLLRVVPVCKGQVVVKIVDAAVTPPKPLLRVVMRDVNLRE